MYVTMILEHLIFLKHLFKEQIWIYYTKYILIIVYYANNTLSYYNKVHPFLDFVLYSRTLKKCI